MNPGSWDSYREKNSLQKGAEARKSNPDVGYSVMNGGRNIRKQDHLGAFKSDTFKWLLWVVPHCPCPR